MPIANFWTVICPPGIPKEHMKSLNPGASQGGSSLPGYVYKPTDTPKVDNVKQIFNFNQIVDAFYQPLQTEEDGTNRVLVYKNFASTMTNNIGGTGSAVVMSGGYLTPQFDMICDKTFESFTPCIPGKSEKHKIKLSVVTPYIGPLFLTTETASGSDGKTYSYVTSAVTDLSAMGNPYPCAGVTSMYISAAAPVDKFINTFFDGVCGPYTTFSSLYGNQPVFPPDRMIRGTDDILPTNTNDVYGKMPGISGDAGWQGAWQLPMQAQGFAPYGNGDRWYAPWFTDVSDLTYREVALQETRKFFPRYTTIAVRVNEEIDTTPISGSVIDPWAGKRFYIITPRLDYGEASIFGRHPICKRIESSDIQSGSNMEFLVGKYIIWCGSSPMPIIVNDNPGTGWQENSSQASYSKFSPNLKFTPYPLDGGIITTNKRDYISITPVDDAVLAGSQIRNISGSPAPFTKSHHVCYGTSGAYYGRSFVNGQPKVNPAYTGEPPQTQEDLYLWDTPWDVVGSANETLCVAPWGSAQKVVFYTVSYKMNNGNNSGDQSENYDYPAQVQVGWYRVSYDSTVGGMKPVGSVSYINLPVVSTGEAPTDGSVFGAYRLHMAEIDPSVFGADHALAAPDIRYFIRYKHPNPDIGWDIFSFSAGIGLPYCFFKGLQGTLPYPYHIPQFKPSNALLLEEYDPTKTTLKGYIDPRYIWDTETHGTWESIMQSNGRSLGTFTSSGSISGDNYQFSITGIERYYYPNSSLICDETHNQSQAKSQHMIQIIRVNDGQSFAGLPNYGQGNALWKFNDFKISAETGAPDFWQDDRNKNYYFTSKFTNRKIFDQRKNSDIIIKLSLKIPLIINFPLNSEFVYKNIVLRRWLVKLDGTSEEIYNIDNDGFED